MEVRGVEGIYVYTLKTQSSRANFSSGQGENCCSDWYFHCQVIDKMKFKEASLFYTFVVDYKRLGRGIYTPQSVAYQLRTGPSFINVKMLMDEPEEHTPIPHGTAGLWVFAYILSSVQASASSAFLPGAWELLVLISKLRKVEAR